MSYVEQQLQNWFVCWFFDWMNMVSVKFLGCQCFIQPFFWVIIASIVVSTTSWSSRVDVCKNFTCMLSLNASLEWCLWWASFGFFQNLEDKSMNALGTNIYWPRWGAQSHNTCFGAVSLHAICAIQGHQHKKVYSPSCFNEILSLISKILLLQSLIFSSRDKARARMRFHF